MLSLIRHVSFDCLQIILKMWVKNLTTAELETAVCLKSFRFHSDVGQEISNSSSGVSKIKLVETKPTCDELILEIRASACFLLQHRLIAAKNLLDHFHQSCRCRNTEKWCVTKTESENRLPAALQLWVSVSLRQIILQILVLFVSRQPLV